MPRTINETIEAVKIDRLKPHPRNVNQGDFGAIQQSVETNGFYGTIVANKRTGHILAGNHRWQVAKAMHYETVPVAWVDVDDEQELRILIADNRTTRLGIDNEASLTELLAELAATPTGLLGTGFDGDDLDALIANVAGDSISDDNNYSRKIEAPTYEPTGECPTVESLYDISKHDELIKRIDNSDVPASIKSFLRYAAGRHIVFDYRNIAEFYAHAGPDVQQLFEDSALVIIDFDSAIQNGFVRMVEKMKEIVGDDLATDD